MLRPCLKIRSIFTQYIDKHDKSFNDVYSILTKLREHNNGSLVPVDQIANDEADLLNAYYVVYANDDLVSVVATRLRSRWISCWFTEKLENLRNMQDDNTKNIYFKLSWLFRQVRVLKLNANNNKTYRVLRVPRNCCGVAENGSFMYVTNKAKCVKQTTLADAWQMVTQDIDKEPMDYRWLITTKNDVVLFML